jgi:parallel beta-helix repeat protein
MVQKAKAAEIIYIRADGSVEPEGTPISTLDNVTYTFNDNINASMLVERDNITVDGAGHTLFGSGPVYGIEIDGRKNVTFRNIQVRAIGKIGIWFIDSSNCSVLENMIMDSGCAFRFDRSSNNSVVGNTITRNTSGGYIQDSSNNNTIRGNTISDNQAGAISIYSSLNNSIVGNTIKNNTRGILIGSSSNNTSIINNVFIRDGLEVMHSYQNIVKNNTVNGKPLVYLEDISEYTVTDAGQVILVNCDSIRVENLDLSNTTIGVHLDRTNNSIISGNTITTNIDYGIRSLGISSNITILGNNITSNDDCGIVVGIDDSRIIGNTVASSHDTGIVFGGNSNTIAGNNIRNNGYGMSFIGSSNTVSGNNITNNEYGLSVQGSSNRIYHNNIVNNTYQVNVEEEDANIWDDGLEGNYWSDYAGVDLNHDGIGDSAYMITPLTTPPELRQFDHYPLIGMFSSFNTSLGYSVNVVSNSTIESFEYFESNSTIRMHVSNVTANQTFGFVRICVPHALMNNTYQVKIDSVEPYYVNYTLYDNGTHRWIYFSYQHSTLEIIITPEFPPLMLLTLFMMATLVAAIVYKRKKPPLTRCRKLA